MAHLFVREMSHDWLTLALERDRYCISVPRPEPRSERIVANDTDSVH